MTKNSQSIIKSGLISAIICLMLFGYAFAGSNNFNRDFIGNSTTSKWVVLAIFEKPLVWAILLTIVIQLIGWAISATKQTEKLFDAFGAGTFFLVTVLLIFFGGPVTFWRVVFALTVLIWAGRLGYFLASRVHKKSDDRFDEIKKNPARFLLVWMIQAVWISVTAGVAWSVLGSGRDLAAVGLSEITPRSSSNLSDFGALGSSIVFLFGLVIWLVGLVIEAVADAQKRAFRNRAENANRFITTGLWRYSQHPNYFGEILLWLGVAIAGLPYLEGNGALGWTPYLMLLSPVLVVVLLTKVSGIPTLDKKADARWGDDPDYQDYRRRTSVLIPLPPR